MSKFALNKTKEHFLCFLCVYFFYIVATLLVTFIYVKIAELTTSVLNVIRRWWNKKSFLALSAVLFLLKTAEHRRDDDDTLIHGFSRKSLFLPFWFSHMKSRLMRQELGGFGWHGVKASRAHPHAQTEKSKKSCSHFFLTPLVLKAKLTYLLRQKIIRKILLLRSYNRFRIVRVRSTW